MKTCECNICSNNLPFEMPNEIIDALISGDLVLFAGAGISTETKAIFKTTLYEDVIEELELDIESDISFPELMSKYCSTYKNGRQKLLEKIKYRFDYCHQFKDLYNSASAFHKEIAPLWMLKNIITTNWDDYFERECSAIPIVTPKDFAFYNINQRKVFKIHGSISNYGSLVATEEDYHECYEELNSGLIGANLKTLMSTKTILFVGYSFRDFDFLKVLEFLKKEMGNVFPHIYVVTLDDNISDRISELDLTVIKTNGTFFFKSIKEHLENKGYLIPYKNVSKIYEIEYLKMISHSALSDFYFDKRRTSSIIYCLMYQDGIQHAIDYLKYKSKSGETYCPEDLYHQIELYIKDIRKKLSKAKNYMDLAYVDGYIQGLTIPLFDREIEEFPLFYIFGIGPTNDTELVFETFAENIIRHKTAEKYGNNFFKEYLKTENDVIPDHRPFF
jgi:hypothetical protein